ncbi:MAG: hypothetical protein ABSG59_11785 [Verrucomicrobiota bacterium]|jgi:hypothetical protein
MSAFGILLRRSIFAACILTHLVTGCDRGPSTIAKHITQQINDTKRQFKPADIQAALSPFFSAQAASNNFPKEISALLPDQIRSLPIFSDNPDGIMAFLDSSNSLMMMVGSGFGHWGMVVIRPGSQETYDGNNLTASIPWGDGVYFFSQYR